MAYGRLIVRQLHTMMDTQLQLIRDKAYVNGAWVGAASGKTFNVLNPANGKVVGCVPDMNAADTLKAIEAAWESFQTWQLTTPKERSEYLRKWYDVLQKNHDNLASLITAEAGKPWKEAHGEVTYGNSFMEWFSEEARRIHGEILASPNQTKEMILFKQPIGVAGLITPWNFPIAMITRKAGAAIAAGCTCIVKPAEDTPLTALALAQLAEEAGLPKGVFNVITTNRENAPEVGKLLCESPLVAGISFTGSTAVGKLLYKQSASTVKRLALELGGNAPFIVFSSADIDKAVDGAIASKFRNCGQTCVSANRLLIQDDLFDTFIEKITNKVKSLKMGCGTDHSCNLGPLINVAQANKVKDIVEDAINKGAKVHTGGKAALELGERFFEPTVLTNVDKSMKCYNEEIFGPVAVCIRFKNEEEAIAVSNATRQGLAGYFFSNNLSQIWRVAKKLEVGMVGVNEGIISTAEAAFGGIKESGLGREGSHHGIDEFTYVKYMCFGGL
ncbi:succinate-semialdehyde dehydrogenase, mitochondrial [Periplaneta americana]|uniref:succinate-semialdehyde dehydrogenase, mitochondrial n=1 Tax=Periplaneta americana TaxID=6978 RepID=UPI0037E7F69F